MGAAASFQQEADDGLVEEIVIAVPQVPAVVAPAVAPRLPSFEPGIMTRLGAAVYRNQLSVPDTNGVYVIPDDQGRTSPWRTANMAAGGGRVALIRTQHQRTSELARRIYTRLLSHQNTCRLDSFHKIDKVRALALVLALRFVSFGSGPPSFGLFPVGSQPAIDCVTIRRLSKTGACQ